MARTNTRKVLLTLGIFAIATTTTACNTVKGLGRDIESVGEAGDRVI
ncbi:MAG: entericidin A/B family lipoprotein [Sphingomonadaceae bacterium]|nr:MAG: entericidin A/B family lipoprotein [Sphingomonadaceae bacterium]